MEINRDTVAITDLDSYRENIEKIRSYIGPKVHLMAVVKANAYGHGMVECSKSAIEAGASMLGVAYAMEGVRLREAGITAPILVMACESSDFIPLFFEHDLTLGISSHEIFETLRNELKSQKNPCKVHIKVDTGMGRVGFRPSEVKSLIEMIKCMSELIVEGIFTHFPSADESDQEDFCHNQIKIFSDLLNELKSKGLRPPLAHMCNSAGTLKFPEAHFDLVRIGLMSYGLVPYPGSEKKFRVKPVLSWKSKVAFIKEVPAGFTVSYSRTFSTSRPSRLATVPVGYADGYRRFLSNRGMAIIKGVKVPIAGRICMDQTVFDITEAGDVRIGDVVTLIGRDNSETITVEDLAALGGTISHEIVTGITGRVSRSYNQSARTFKGNRD
jgi:alanine racemase